MFTDADIKQQIEERRNNSTKGILIAPFENKYLTPVGYDFRVGVKGFSWKNKCEFNIEQDEGIEIEPNDTVVIETLESVSLSKEVTATIHGMATRVILQGLSHISTTIDPGWTGKLLISIHNYRDSSVELRFKASFCTVCFYKAESQSQVSLSRPIDRDDLWEQLIEISRQEKKKQKRGNFKHNIIISCLTVIFLVGGVLVCLNKPELGSALATLIALFSPFVYEQIKSK